VYYAIPMKSQEFFQTFFFSLPFPSLLLSAHRRSVGAHYRGFSD
ncbi:hypothetical protein HMPREF0693_2221, partial [Proteus mirabilis ATCC 29906]